MTQNTTRPITLFVVLTLAVMFLLPTSVALHCNGEITEITVEGQGFYIDDRSDETNEINHWMYLESNGVEGLQSGNDSISDLRCSVMEILVPICFTESCEHPDPDTLVF